MSCLPLGQNLSFGAVSPVVKPKNINIGQPQTGLDALLVIPAGDRL
jgi:hypothetical protein